MYVAKHLGMGYFQSWGCYYDIFVKEVGYEIYSHSCFNFKVQSNGNHVISSSSTSAEESGQKEQSEHNIPKDEESEATSKAPYTVEEVGINKVSRELGKINECNSDSQGKSNRREFENSNMLHEVDDIRT